MNEQNQSQQGNVNLNIDNTPVLYTDVIFWNISPDGIVLNFGQTIMGTNQVKIITRVGMSREHAKKLSDKFGKDIALTETQGQTGKKTS